MTLSQLLERWPGASSVRWKTAREKRSFRPALEGLERRDLLSATMLADQQPLVNTSMSSYLSSPAPFTLTATAVSQTQINLSWNSVAGAKGYVVDELMMWNGDFTQIGNLGSGSTSESVTGLSPGTGYYFEVSASGTAATAWSGATTAPVAPSFTVKVVSGTQINLSVSYAAGAGGYLIDEWSNGAWTQLSNNLTLLGGTVSITGLSPGTTYDFEVAAYNGGGTTWAPPQSATTFVAAPSFTLTPASQTRINISWGSVADASGYLIDEWVNGTWTQIGNVDSGSTSYSVNGLLPGITYYFNVGAYNAAGTTWAGWQSATLPVDHPAAGGAYIPVRGSLFGPNGPSFLDVRQGAVGDCWLLASLAEVAARVPSDIRNMFTYDGSADENGSVVGFYSVRLFDQSGVPHSILVDTELPMLNGGVLYDRPVNGVLWVALAEKAYAQANGAGLVTTGCIGSDSYNALSGTVALPGGDPSWALQAITGLPANDFSLNTNSLATAWNAGKLIVLWTNNPTSSYILPSHAYAVVGYNPSSSSPFEVFNPWGTNSSGWAPGIFNGHPVYGLFLADAAFLSQNYSYQSIGVGAENGTDGHAKALQAMTDLIVAVDQVDALQFDQNLAGFGPLPRRQENLAQRHTR